MNDFSGEQHGGDISAKEILIISGTVTALVGAWVAYMTLEYNPHDRKAAGSQHGAPTHLVADRQAKIVSESLGVQDEDPSLLLRQTLPDGRIVTVRKPVFAGEVMVHDPGDTVVPDELAKPLP
jgi:hypothetical protein